MKRMPFFLFAPWVVALTAPSTRADLHFAQPTVQVGEVRSGTPLAQRFTFVNRGPGALEITDVHTSCGCLTPRLEQRAYKAGESGTLLVEINTLTQPAGPHTWRAQVIYQTDGQRGEVQLHLRGRVVTEISVQPAALTIIADQTIGHEITLIDSRPRPLSITAVHTSSAHLKARALEAARNADGHLVRKISLEVTADYPEGRRDEVVYLVTSDPAYPELKVPVTVVKRSRQRLSATPSSVMLQAPAGQALPSRVVLIRDANDEPVVVERVVADDAAIGCSFAQGTNGVTAVKISVDRTRVTGDHLDTAIHIHVSKPVPDILHIPVHCRLK